MGFRCLNIFVQPHQIMMWLNLLEKPNFSLYQFLLFLTANFVFGKHLHRNILFGWNMLGEFDFSKRSLSNCFNMSIIGHRILLLFIQFVHCQLFMDRIFTIIGLINVDMLGLCHINQNLVHVFAGCRQFFELADILLRYIGTLQAVYRLLLNRLFQSYLSVRLSF